MSKATFPGFDPKALTFFRQLAKHNDRDWFTANKQTYVDFVEKPMIDLVAIVGEAMRRFAGDYVREPKKHLYRIYRDTRFSKDKTPYKSHLGAQFQHPQVTKNLGAGFYFHVSAKELCIAGGIYMPGPEELAALRAAFCADAKPFRARSSPTKRSPRDSANPRARRPRKCRKDSTPPTPPAIC